MAKSYFAAKAGKYWKPAGWYKVMLCLVAQIFRQTFYRELFQFVTNLGKSILSVCFSLFCHSVSCVLFHPPSFTLSHYSPDSFLIQSLTLLRSSAPLISKFFLSFFLSQQSLPLPFHPHLSIPLSLFRTIH
jgi:hypothetical protein